MSTLDRIDEYLRRATQEDKAASSATSVEARLSHQRLAGRLRHTIAHLRGRLPGAGE